MTAEVLDLSSRPEGFRRVTAALAAAGQAPPRWLEVPARTSQEAAEALGVAVGQIAKCVVFRRQDDAAASVLVVAAGDRRVDEARVAALTGPLARADADFVKARTGYSIGGVSPLAHSPAEGAAPTLLLDRSLFRFDVVWAAAGHPNGVFCASPAALVALTGAPVADVVQEPTP
jgi:prolyl-tRNA editing enzyme YbaK/EbsC (Cys-tRNA(Pro) deacylase)